MKTRKKYVTIFWWTLFFLTVIAVWAVQRAVPFMMDDVWYSTRLYSEEPLSSFADIIKAQVWHYQNWGGRSVAHTILQCILCMGELAADVLNTAAVFVLSYLIAKMAGARRSLPFIVVTSGALHGLNAAWKLSMYWQSGACNYLYITIFILLFLLCYTRTYSDTTDHYIKDLPGIVIWILPLGLFAGWSNENMGPAVWLVTLGIILWRKRQKLPVRFWMILGNLSCLAGSVLMIAAPGNFVRSVEAASNNYGLLHNLFLRMYAECRGLFDYLFPAVFFAGAAVFVFVGIMGERLNRKEWMLLVCALLSFGAMILSPHYPDRAAFGTIVLLLCTALSVIYRMLELHRDKRVRYMAGVFGVFLWLRGMYFLGEHLALNWGWIV